MGGGAPKRSFILLGAARGAENVPRRREGTGDGRLPATAAPTATITRHALALGVTRRRRRRRVGRRRVLLRGWEQRLMLRLDLLQQARLRRIPAQGLGHIPAPAGGAGLGERTVLPKPADRRRLGASLVRRTRSRPGPPAPLVPAVDGGCGRSTTGQGRFGCSRRGPGGPVIGHLHGCTGVLLTRRVVRWEGALACAAHLQPRLRRRLRQLQLRLLLLGQPLMTECRISRHRVRCVDWRRAPCRRRLRLSVRVLLGVCWRVAL